MSKSGKGCEGRRKNGKGREGEGVGEVEVCNFDQ